MRTHKPAGYKLPTQVIYIEFRPASVAETRDLDENTQVDFDERGGMCAMTIEHASERASRHLLDALVAVPLIDQLLPSGGTFADLGSGGGFPGAPLAARLLAAATGTVPARAGVPS